MAQASIAPPICVEPEGTLTAANPAHEQLLWLAKNAPRTLLSLLPRWSTDRAAFWSAVAARSQIAFESLPYREELLEWLRAERAQGRRIVMLACEHGGTAERIAAHLGVFDETPGTQACGPESAARRRAGLLARYGGGGFDYVTASATNETLWSIARGTVVVGGSGLAGQAARTGTVLRMFAPARPSWRAWLQAMRLHQWVKNALVFLPALLAHAILSAAVLRGAVLAYLAFGLCASSVYLCNDLLDLDADRRHFRKRRRPFAAGVLSVRSGVA
ncbi:MAG TPA: hypothetical protein VN859_05570, partial [Steroidobacteraceae bacterium]|nr:hypothetical protein [Steroidobacteraceae bacterium]